MCTCICTHTCTLWYVCSIYTSYQPCFHFKMQHSRNYKAKPVWIPTVTFTSWRLDKHIKKWEKQKLCNSKLVFWRILLLEELGLRIHYFYSIFKDLNSLKSWAGSPVRCSLFFFLPFQKWKSIPVLELTFSHWTLFPL